MLCAWMWMELEQRDLCVEVEGATGNRLCAWRWRELEQRDLCVEVEGARETSSVFILHSSILCSEQRLFFCKQTSCDCCLVQSSSATAGKRRSVQP